MIRKLAISCAAFILVGCTTTQVNLVPTGGSRSDGTVSLSYEYAAFETPQMKPEQGLSVAKERCSAWGYSGAEAFGGETRQCQIPTQYGCNRWMATVTYQCTGNPPS